MSEWISIKDRLPEEGVPLIVNRYNKKLNFSSVCRDEYLGYGIWGDKDFCEKTWEITHWMPIPKPPIIKHSHILEIPDEDIVYTKDKWLVLNMESEHLGKAIKQIIDYSCGKKEV